MLARKVLKSEKYKPISTRNNWGDMQIKAKAMGEEEGKSPAHWIAVRANLYMTRLFDIMASEEFDYSYLYL